MPAASPGRVRRFVIPWLPFALLQLATLLICGAVEATPEKPAAPSGRTGEVVDPALYGPAIIEDLGAVRARERAGPPPPLDPNARNGQQGVWVVPSERSACFPGSGSNYVTNKWGDTRMGIGFPEAVTVHSACFAGRGSGSGVWTTGVRVIGYYAGQEVGATEWFTDIGDSARRFDIELLAVDRVVIEAQPVLNGAGWYGMDDLTYSRGAEDGSVEPETVVVDFEDASRGEELTGSDYAGLIWETGTGDFIQPDDMMPAPVPPAPEKDAPQDSAPDQIPGPRGVLNPPVISTHWDAVKKGDAGSSTAPPDTCGAIGPDHFVETVNRVFAVYDRTDGSLITQTLLGTFLVGSNGDPRVIFDQHAGRWIIIVSDFSTRIYLAFSLSSDPTANWFKTSFVVSEGSDAGCFPDYPTLGVDENGIYVSAFMAGCNHSVFAIDKAPLLAASPSLGTITAFRNLSGGGAIQPVHTYGAPPGQYFVNVNNSSSLRVRRVDPPLTAPTLVNLGTVSIPSHAEPPDAPSLGSTTPLDTVGARLMNAVYREGSIWTAHCIGLDGRAACRFYQVDPVAMSLLQSGTVSDDSLYFFFPGVAVNAAGDVVMGFSGSNASEYAAAYVSARLATDVAGAMSTPVLLREGDAPQNNIDGFGRNRWGDYSLTTLDPNDEVALWTIQEYAHATNIWGTHVAKVFVEEPDCNNNLIPDGCDISCGVEAGICDLPGCGQSEDCNNNAVPDECEGDECPPTPDPMTFAVLPPVVLSDTQIQFEATTAIDNSAGVEYFFDKEFGPACCGADSGWQASPVHVAGGMRANSSYSYKVKARDTSPAHNETELSLAFATNSTFIETPFELTLLDAQETQLIVMISCEDLGQTNRCLGGAFTDLSLLPSGLFLEMTPAAGSGANVWTSAQTINVTGLSPGTDYTFRAKARNRVAVETPFSGEFLFSTTGAPIDCPNMIPGDLNQDSLVNGADVDGYVRAKLGLPPAPGEEQACADFATGTLDGDTAAFVSALLQ